MRLKEFNIILGQKRTYGYTNFGINNRKTMYLDCKVTNTKTGKTIDGITLNVPVRDNMEFLRDSFNWENKLSATRKPSIRRMKR